METEHFRIFYNPGSEDLARFAAWDLEETYKKYSQIFNTEIENKTPVILYKSHKDFQQTNITLDIIEEGVGGFTESLKRRVVVPFTGSWSVFKHVLDHELVHVFQFEIFFKNLRNPLSIATQFRIPLWVIEGTAEFFSQGWSPDAESYIRDQVFNNSIVPISKLSSYGGYIIYKQGQAFFKYLSDKFGEKQVADLIHLLKLHGNLGDAVKKALGMTLENVNESFETYYKKRVFPLIAHLSVPERENRITDHTKSGGFLNVGPTISPDGTKIAYVSDRTGYTDIYLASAITGEEVKRIVSGGKTPNLENLHLLRPGVSFSPDGKKLVFSAQATESDLLHIVDIETKKIVSSFRPNLDAIYTPVWSPDTIHIAFVGLKDGQSDIYLLNLDKGVVRKITSDIYEDKDPSFSADGRRLYFVSEVTENGNLEVGRLNIIVYDLDSDNRERVLPLDFGYLRYPFAFGDSGIAFLTIVSGVPNIVYYNRMEKRFYSITRYLTGVRELSISGNRVAFSMLWKGGYDIFLTKWEFLNREPWSPDTTSLFVSINLDSLPIEGSKDYSLEFSIDWFSGALEYASPFGFFGTTTIGISDALGDHRLLINTDLFQDVQTSNFELLYLYLPQRTDYGIYAYSLWNAYYLSFDQVYLEQNRGLLLMAYYPFTRFLRFEVGLGYESPTRYLFTYDYGLGGYVNTGSVRYNTFQGYTGLVYDNALYTFYYPIDGTRMFIGGALTTLDLDQKVFLADFRKYFRLTPRSSLALRLMAGVSGGKDALPFWLGGPSTLRGYDYYDILGKNMLLFNSELRIPFIDYLKMSFPLPIELRGIRGVLFLDIGSAWNNLKDFRPFESAQEWIRLRDLYSGLGVGLRIGLGFFNIKLDIAKRTDLTSLSQETRYYLTFGRDY